MRSRDTRTYDMHALAHRYNESDRLRKLVGMLRNTLRNWGPARMMLRPGDIGVSWEDGSYLRIQYSGPWSNADMRDLFALFATWCAVDGDRIILRNASGAHGASPTGNAHVN